METHRTSESLEISTEMPHDAKHSKSESSTKHDPKKSTKMTKSKEDEIPSKTKDGNRNDPKQVYENLITCLRQNDHQKMEYKVKKLKQLWQKNQLKMEHKVVIVEIFIFLCFIAIITAIFIAQELKQQLLLNINSWKWALLLGSVFCGLSIIRSGTFIMLQYLIVPIFKLNKNVVFFASGLKTSVDILLWLGLILAFWLTWFRRGIIKHNQTSEFLHYITRTLIALVLGAFFWILKNTLLLKLESDLHINRFFERIRYGVLHLHGIHMIAKKEDWKFEGIDEKEREKFLKTVHGMNRSMKKDAPTWVVKRLADLFEKSLKKLPHVNSEEFCDDEKLIDHVAVKNLLPKVVGHHEFECEGIKRADLEDQARLTKTEAEVLHKLLQVFEFSVTSKTFIMWVTHAYRTCWSLRHSLRNSRGALNQLNKLLTSFLVIVVIVIWLLLTEIATQSTLAVAFSPFLAASFMFGDSCKTMFQGIIFVFVTHPFEVGDHCVIDGQQMKVDKVNILTTEFCKPDGEPVVYPNSVLATKDIINFYSSRSQRDILPFNVDDATNSEAIQELKTKIKSYLEKSHHLCSNVEVLWDDFGKIVVYFQYVVSHPDSKVKAKVKSDLLYNIKKFLQELNIEPISECTKHIC